MTSDPQVLFYLTLALAASGVIKGISGTGLPLIAVPLLTFAVPMPVAVALISVSLIVTNVVQAATTRRQIPTALCRYWALMLTLPFGTFLGTYLLARTDPGLVERFTGLVVIAVVGYILVGGRVMLSRRLRFWVIPLAGISAGVIGGLTAIFAPPLLVLLLSTREPKEVFVATLALAFILGSVALALFLAGFDLMDAPLLLWSTVAAVPVILGQLVGTRLRHHVPEALFRRAVQVILLFAGLKLVIG